MIHGRGPEQAAIDRLLAGAVDGRSGALVIRGEEGIGKSTLLEYAAGRACAREMPVLRGVGVETEAELPYAALHLILHPHRHQFDTLPGPQATALRAAFGMAEMPPGDRFLAGVGVLTLLSDLAGDGPLLVLVDDAQWIDKASAGALLFAARRLEAEGIAMIFAGRDRRPAFHLPGLPELRVTGLDRAKATDLLAARYPRLAPSVRERVLAEAGGNPLALLELPAALTSEQRAGTMPGTAGTAATGSTVTSGTARSGSGSGSGLVRQAFLDQISSLPEHAQLLLLVAAADDTGDPAVLIRTAERLRVGLDALEPAEASGLARVAGGTVAFRHPLIRSAAYHGAPLGRRLAVHRALADTFDSSADADRRAWHLAASTAEPDEAVAAALEQSAEHARARGGYAAVAAAYQRAAALTPDPARRVRRLAAAARAAAAAGVPELAAALAAKAGPQATEPLVQAELALVRNALAHEQDHPQSSAELAEAASMAAEQDPETAALMVVDAMAAGWASGDLNAAAAVAGTATRMSETASASRLLAGVKTTAVHLAAGDLRQAVPHMRELLQELGGSGHGVWERATIMWWYDLLLPSSTAYREAASLVRDCRAEGAIGLLPRALMHLARALLRLGRYLDACTSGGEGLRIAQDTGQPHFAGHLRGLLACVAAIEGEEERCLDVSDGALAHGLTEKSVETLQALSLLDLGLGRPAAILDRWERLAVGAGRDTALGAIATLPDYIEAAARTGKPELAAEPYARLAAWSEATDQPWARAVALRCQALLAPDESAGDWYEQAEKFHSQDDQPFERARTALLHGEWLRRRLLRTAARGHLRSALETFELLGAAPWAERARGELRASGEAHETRGRGTYLLDRLTPQELQVVRLAAAGLSNRDIGAQLFLSPRTVGYHLSKAYPKLGVVSRHDLARMDLG